MHQTGRKTTWADPGMKLGLLVMVGLMVGLKVVDTLVQPDAALSPDWRWTLYAGLAAGVFGGVVTAYRMGLNSGAANTDE
ncbi:MAG: hypothetical protein R3B90_09205 [Planctomycetaceae bacterium]